MVVQCVQVYGQECIEEGLFLFCLEANVCTASCKVTIDEFLELVVFFKFYFPWQLV